MCSSDSFNDSLESDLNLYSFKNVTQTYQTQLKKLLTKNVKLSEGDYKRDGDLSDNNKQNLKKRSCESKKKKTKIAKPCFSESIGLESCSSDEAVEIIEELPRKTVRRSERLKNKNLNYVYDSVLNIDSNNKILPPLRKGKKRKSRKQFSEKPHLDEIILEDSVIEFYDNTKDEELNPEISVKVVWQSISIKKFLMRKFQKMSTIFKDLSKKEKVPENKIILIFKNKKVNHSDTPDSLNLQVYDFLEGGIINDSSIQCELSTPEVLKNDDCSVLLKFQNNKKEIIKLALNKNDKLQICMIKYSEQVEMPLENIKFFFDGEVLNPNETPTSLGLENDDIIDTKF